MYILTPLSSNFLANVAVPMLKRESLQHGQEGIPDGTRMQSYGCSHLQIEMKVGRANAALLWNATVPHLTWKEVIQNSWASKLLPVELKHAHMNASHISF